MKIEDGGHWVVIKEVSELTSGDADDWLEAADVSYTLPEGAENMTPEEFAASARATLTMTPKMVNAQRNAVMAVLITDWDLGIALPREDPASCRQIPLGLRRKIEQAAQPHMLELRRQPDPKEAATTTSSASNGSLRAGRPSSRKGSTGGRSATS